MISYGGLFEYCSKIGCSYSTNVDMKSYTSFHIGGAADVMVFPENAIMLSNVIRYITDNGLRYLVIGKGSNMLISDDGYRGVVINTSSLDSIGLFDETTIYCQSGISLAKLCRFALDNSLTGLEFAYGIPGTVGGAMVMNAGAYDGEMSMVVEKVQLMDKEGKSFSLSCEEMEFGYRDSILKRKDYFVLETTFLLKAGNKEDIKAKMDDFLERRRSKQPLEHPSAGSTFKRPEGYFAGKLIMDAGLSGKRIGGVCVSPKHCGFIVNDCGGTAKDISDLIKLVKKEVQDKYGVSLEPEVISIGSFD